MSFLLFQGSVAVYLLAVAAYLVFFLTQKTPLRRIGRTIFLVAFLAHTAALIARAFETGHTPITSHHETVSFFAWSLGCCYLSFRWRYTIKNLGIFVSTLVLGLMLVAAFSSRAIIPLPSPPRSSAEPGCTTPPRVSRRSSPPTRPTRCARPSSCSAT